MTFLRPFSVFRSSATDENQISSIDAACAVLSKKQFDEAPPTGEDAEEEDVFFCTKLYNPIKGAFSVRPFGSAPFCSFARPAPPLPLRSRPGAPGMFDVFTLFQT